MISLIIKSYFVIFLAIGAGLVFIMLSSLFWFLIRNRLLIQEKIITDAEPIKPTPIRISSKDITAIAGEDVFATQLDLARAYIETGRKQLAKKILQFVIQQGTSIQQEEAKRLLHYL